MPLPYHLTCRIQPIHIQNIEPHQSESEMLLRQLEKSEVMICGQTPHSFRSVILIIQPFKINCITTL